MHVHLVQPGETLTELAQRYRVTPGQLSLCNDLPPSAFLLPGQTLCIPSRLDVSGTEGFFTYRVQAGDTPRSISEAWQIPLTWLAFCNDLNELNDQTLQTGELLLLPHTAQQVQKRPTLRVISHAPLTTYFRGFELSYDRYLPQLRVDAAGNVLFPALAERGVEIAEDRFEKNLMICTLDGSPNILPDVARAILRSDHAMQRILDRLAAGVRQAGGDGVIFAWEPLRPESEVAYLAFVREAGRRLRPMGLTVGLQISAGSSLLKRTSVLQPLVEAIDLFLYDPASQTPVRSPLFQKQAPPAPLVGVEATRTQLQALSEQIPPAKTWLLLHPVALVCKKGDVVQRLTVRQAMHLAYAQGAPLCTDPPSELAWFRAADGDGGYSVWLEDLGSFIRKLELLEEYRLGGLAIAEEGADFPAAWHYVAERYETQDDEETEGIRKKGSVS